jgi:membrane protease YdiL (CAAX protease family)
VDVLRLLRPSREAPRAEAPDVGRRRRWVVAVTAVVGTTLLAATLAVPVGSGRFTALGLLVATVWIIGSLLSGPLHLGRRGGLPRAQRELLAPVVLGVAAFVVFFLADIVARRVPRLGAAVDSILTEADAGPVAIVLGVALVNGIAEEVFFRGAVQSTFRSRHAVRNTTAVYVVVTLATLNGALVVAAAMMGALLSRERQATRGILAPVITHATWSTLMLLALPP